MKSRSKSPAACRIAFSFALDEPDDLILIEEWSDGAALAHHLSSAHFAAFSQRLRSALRGPARFIRYDIANASPLSD